MEEQVNALAEDKSIYEEKTFSGRNFKTISKYFKSIREPLPVPFKIHWLEKTAETDEAKATLFNSYFQSVFTHSPVNETLNGFYDADSEPATKVEITVDTISQYLNKLKLNKATCPDSIPNQLLKNVSCSLSKSLHLLFKTCHNKGKCPGEWKTSLKNTRHYTRKEKELLLRTTDRYHCSAQCPKFLNARFLIRCTKNSDRNFLNTIMVSDEIGQLLFNSSLTSKSSSI